MAGIKTRFFAVLPHRVTVAAVAWVAVSAVVLMMASVGCSGGDAPEASVPSNSGEAKEGSSQTGAGESQFGKTEASRPPVVRSGRFNPEAGSLGNSTAGAATNTNNGIGDNGITDNTKGLPKSKPTQLSGAESPKVVFTTRFGDIIVELDVANAPVTVANFLENYVDRQRYDGLLIHHVDPQSLVATGGFYSQLRGVERRADILNEADNGQRAVRGSLTMARHPDYRNSANSEFWFNMVDNPTLDHVDGTSEAAFGYCTFGHVIQGMDVLERITQVQVEQRDGFPRIPTQELLIESTHRSK